MYVGCDDSLSHMPLPVVVCDFGLLVPYQSLVGILRAPRSPSSFKILCLPIENFLTQRYSIGASTCSVNTEGKSCNQSANKIYTRVVLTCDLDEVINTLFFVLCMFLSMTQEQLGLLKFSCHF